jgi:hypothetical protein
LRQIRQDFGFQSPEEKRFHDPFGVRDPVLLVLRPVVFVTLITLHETEEDCVTKGNIL